ncbi:MAG: hypothetical protein JW929_05530 [Anaerolineales bacterium]|nr:hypothetical protein [Anaerolineales bacterium]
MGQRSSNGKAVRVHGILSLAFAGTAVGLGAAAVFRASIWFGVCYLLLCPAAMSVVLFAYCAKCPCKGGCAHVLPGKAAALFRRRPGPYSAAEIAALCASLLLLTAIPQPFLWRHPAWLAVFWVLMGVAAVQIRGAVCRACGNLYCPINPSNRP